MNVNIMMNHVIHLYNIYVFRNTVTVLLRKYCMAKNYSETEIKSFVCPNHFWNDDNLHNTKSDIY